MLLLFWSVLGKEIVKRRMIIYIFSLSFSGDCALSPWKLRNSNLVLEISWPEWACMQHYCLLVGIWLCKTVRDTCFLYLHWTQPCHHWCLDLDSGPGTFPVVSSILMFPLPYHSSSYDLFSSPFIHAQTYFIVLSVGGGGGFVGHQESSTPRVGGVQLCNPVGCSLPGSSVHGILQVRIVEWVAISSFRGSSWPRNWTRASSIAGRFFTDGVMREVQYIQQHSCICWYLVSLATNILRKMQFVCFSINKDRIT